MVLGPLVLRAPGFSGRQRTMFWASEKSTLCFGRKAVTGDQTGSSEVHISNMMIPEGWEGTLAKFGTESRGQQ